MDDIGDGRYRVARALDARRHGGLLQALDTRLGRTVLVQYDLRTPFPGAAAALLDAGQEWLAPLLDGGEDIGPDGTSVAYTVYPDSTWIPLGRLTRPQRRRLRQTVALDTDELLVDPNWLGGRPTVGASPVLWLPSPAELGVARPLPDSWTPVGTLPTTHREEVA